MAKSKRDAYHVFLSHATTDKWMARIMCDLLEDISDVTTFRDDRDIEGGDRIPIRIREEIAKASELIMLLTPTSIQRPWVIFEAGMAYQAGTRIVPICYTVTAKDIPSVPDLRAFNIDDFEQHLDEIDRRVRKGKP